MKITHLSLGVNDLASSERFYREVLGLSAHRENGDVHVRWDDFSLILTEKPPADRGKFHFGFRVNGRDEVDAWAARLRANSVQIISGPAGEGARQLFFLDPDQYVVEIYAD